MSFKRSFLGQKWPTREVSIKLFIWFRAYVHMQIMPRSRQSLQSYSLELTEVDRIDREAGDDFQFLCKFAVIASFCFYGDEF